MNVFEFKYIQLHETYRFVQIIENIKTHKIFYRGQLRIKVGPRYKNCHHIFKTAREAAIYVDKFLISYGKEPVNILKKK